MVDANSVEEDADPKKLLQISLQDGRIDVLRSLLAQLCKALEEKKLKIGIFSENFKLSRNY